MSKTIWKYKLQVTDQQVLEMPACAEFLTVQLQINGGVWDAVLWVVVDPSMPNVPVEIAIYGTGNPIPDNPGRYIATFQSRSGAFAWHVFAPSQL